MHRYATQSFHGWCYLLNGYCSILSELILEILVGSFIDTGDACSRIRNSVKRLPIRYCTEPYQWVLESSLQFSCTNMMVETLPWLRHALCQCVCLGSPCEARCMHLELGWCQGCSPGGFVMWQTKSTWPWNCSFSRRPPCVGPLLGHLGTIRGWQVLSWPGPVLIRTANHLSSQKLCGCPIVPWDFLAVVWHHSISSRFGLSAAEDVQTLWMGQQSVAPKI